MQAVYERLSKLLAVKSIVTIVLTAVFAYLTCSGGVTAEQFLTVFTVVIAFYFGTQAEKRSQTAEAMTGTLVIPDAVSDSDTGAAASTAEPETVQTYTQQA